MTRIHLYVLTLMVAFSLGVASIGTVYAQDPGAQSLELLGQTGLGGGQTAAEAGNRLPVIIGNLVRGALGLLGILLIVLMLYGGFLWMTARGEATQVEKATQTITRAAIGAVIILSAYAITGFVVSAIINAGK